jgi:hypothetical protein
VFAILRLTVPSLNWFVSGLIAVAAGIAVVAVVSGRNEA